jgi:hypothetical protein
VPDSIGRKTVLCGFPPYVADAPQPYARPATASLDTIRTAQKH